MTIEQRPISCFSGLQGELLPVMVVEDSVLVIFGPELSRPITRQGRLISPLDDGWSAEFLYVGTGGLFILHLRNDDGRVGSWFLDSRLDVLPCDFDGLSIAYMTAGRRSLKDSLNGLFRYIFAGIEDGTANPADFLYLDNQLLHRVLRQRLHEIDPGTIEAHLDDSLPGSITRQPTRIGNVVSVSLDRIRSLMERAVLDMAKDIVANGRIEIESIIDGQNLVSDISICLSNFILTYRFIDERNDLPFLLITSTHVCKTVAIFFPLSNEWFVTNAAEGAALRSQCPHGSFGRGCIEHLLQFGLKLVPYVRSPARIAKCLFWHRHPWPSPVAGLNWC